MLTQMFCLAVDLGLLVGVQDINQLEGPWVCKVDDHWTFAINGKDKPADVNITESMGFEKLEPYHMAVFFNGWLAGLLTPFNGTICAGQVGNEDNFIKALNDRIGAEKLAKEFAEE